MGNKCLGILLLGVLLVGCNKSVEVNNPQPKLGYSLIPIREGNLGTLYELKVGDSYYMYYEPDASYGGAAIVKVK